MIEDIKENSNKSLADIEIASLMKTLASKSYRENVSFPKKVVQPFKPISLFEAANKNLKKNEPTNSNDQKTGDLNKETNEELELSKESPEDKIIKPENEPSVQNKSDNENLSELENSEIDTNGTNLKDSQKKELIETNETSATSEIQQITPIGIDESTTTSEIQQITPIGIPLKEKLYTEDELDKEYQKGFLEGTEKEKEKFNEEKEISLKKFNNLIKTIEDRIFIDTNLLERHIKEEIIKITTERVGLLINEMPEEFLNKIKTLSNTIINNVGKKTFKLNPEDFKLVKKLIVGDTFLEKFDILADKTLSRGDCIIEVGEISLEDKMIDRYAPSESSTRYFEIGNNENLDEEKPLPDQDTNNKNINNETSNLMEVSESEISKTGISQEEEIEENNLTAKVDNESENKKANIETFQTDQDIEQIKVTEDTPDEKSYISEGESLTNTSTNTSNTDPKDQDKK